MRDLFPGYYRPTSEEEFKKIWQEAIFSFDANILLNIYRYSSETKERLFEIIEHLIERIWIPHQVAYEYQKERLKVISQQSQPYDEIRKLLDDELEKLKKKLGEYSKRHSFTDCVDSKKIIQTIERANKRVYKILEEGREKYPDLLDDDKFRDKLTNLLEGKVGKPYSNEELDKIYKDAKKRFEKDQPPGYMDDRGKNKKDEPEKYGDVVVWYQLIDYAKSQKKALIFVTDDQKEDWWLKHQGKTIGVRPELVQEMVEKAGVNFYLYTGDKFLEYASSFLKLTEQPEAIEEAREVRLQDDTDQDIDEQKQRKTSSSYSELSDIQWRSNQYQRQKNLLDDIQQQLKQYQLPIAVPDDIQQQFKQSQPQKILIDELRRIFDRYS
ncbi:PIN domain-containing protein [Coleofasciculus sp. E1-EBD-02]|uniref:PIN domain-containing protein n=1 Tax=Coleofasciculus sp. E1-EBD-02 TaxID=3068481 RepID=UPI0032F1779F